MQAISRINSLGLDFLIQKEKKIDAKYSGRIGFHTLVSNEKRKV